MKSQVQWDIVFTLFFCIFFLGYQTSFSQDITNRLDLKLQLTHFMATDENSYFTPLNPGVDILYQHELNNKSAISAGINYSFSVWKYNYFPSNERRLAHEVAIPLLFEQHLGNKVTVILGNYFGWLVSGKAENMSSKFPSDRIDFTEHTNYDDSSRFTWDLYLGIVPVRNKGQKHQFMLEPFVKYKLIDNWMGKVRTKVCFGFSINFSTRIQ